jgi:hypothetical protein
METIIKIALEECANLSIAEAKQIFEAVGGDDIQAIREAIKKYKWYERPI